MSSSLADKVTLYFNPMSRARIAQWMLEEVGAEYELKPIDLKNGEQKSDWYLKINPMGKVPAIVHKGVVITEAAAICMYLGDAYPQAGLAPKLDDPARGTYVRWMFFAAGCIEPAVLEKKAPRREPLHPGWLGFGSFDRVMDTLEALFANGFVLGERFSAADVYIASQIGWGLLQKDIDARPAFVDYHRRCTSRPAAQRIGLNAGM